MKREYRHLLWTQIRDSWHDVVPAIQYKFASGIRLVLPHSPRITAHQTTPS
jgi:hypothetical protein